MQKPQEAEQTLSSAVLPAAAAEDGFNERHDGFEPKNNSFQEGPQ